MSSSVSGRHYWWVLLTKTEVDLCDKLIGASVVRLDVPLKAYVLSNSSILSIKLITTHEKHFNMLIQCECTKLV